MLWLYLRQVLPGSSSSLLLHDMGKVPPSLYGVGGICIQLIPEIRKLCRTARLRVRLGHVQSKPADYTPIPIVELLQYVGSIRQVERGLFGLEHNGQVQRDVPEEAGATLPAG